MAPKKLAISTPKRRKSIARYFSSGNPVDRVETVLMVEEQPLLQCSLLLSNFAKNIKNWQLDGREWELLRTTPFGRLIEYSLELDMTVNIVDALLGFWDEEHCGFVIGGSTVPFTADDIALITGLPNRGLKVLRHRAGWKCNPDFCSIYMSVTHIERRLHSILEDCRSSPNSEADKCFVQQMILYLWGSVLFPCSSRNVREYMSYYVENLELIGDYNWAEEIHSFFVKEINLSSKLLKQRNEGKKVASRYLNGLCYAIDVWFFEHVDFGEDSRPSNPDVRPRMLKWVKVCKFWQRKPFLQRVREIVEDKVSYHIVPKKDELKLLSLDNVAYMATQIIGGSDDALEVGPSLLGNLETNDDSSEMKKSLEKVIHKPVECISVLERGIIKLERLDVLKGCKIENGVNDMDDLSKHKDGEVDKEAHDGKIDREVPEQIVCKLNEAYFHESCIEGEEGLPTEKTGQPSLSENDLKKACLKHRKRKVMKLPIPKEHLFLKKRRNVAKKQPSMRSSTIFGRKGIDILVIVDDYSGSIKQKKETEVVPLNYVGRELLNDNERKYIDDFCAKPMQRDDIVFFNWNIAIQRHSMVEYLQGGYTSEEIIDAYVRILYKRDKMSEDNFANFLYVPPMFLGLYRNKLGSYKTFLDSVDKKSLEKMKFLLLPCLIPTANHWLLLVCDTETQKWTIYDSLYDPRHRGAAKEQIMLLADYLYQDHGFDIRSWSLEYRRIYPQQEPGTLDCGIFVMKFIENIIHVSRTINFRGTDMRLFRPQIAYRILYNC